MRTLLGCCLTLAILGTMVSEASAFGRGCGCCPPPCCPPPCPPQITYVDRTVTCYRPEWREEKVKCVVNRMHYRTEEYVVKCTVMVPRFVDVKEKCTYLVPVPRQVEREVVCCRMVPVQSTDPCTGCVYTCYRPQEFREKVKCTVWECRQETRDVICRVCKYEQQVREIKQKRIIPECRPETVDCVRRFCVMVPYEVKVKVAVCCGP